MEERLKLPGRDSSEEDLWVQAMLERPQEDLLSSVRLAVEAKRPRLAARIVGLLADGEGADDPLVVRARRAAELLFLKGDDAPSESELDELLGLLYERRLRRFKQRHDPRRGKGPRKKPRWWTWRRR